MPVPAFRYRLPADVAVRIRATARPARGPGGTAAIDDRSHC